MFAMSHKFVSSSSLESLEELASLLSQAMYALIFLNGFFWLKG